MKSDEAMTVIDYRIDDPTRRYLVYSKTIKDGLPITTTHFGFQPCMKHESALYVRLNFLKNEEREFYPTELDREKVCKNETGVLLTDPRYQLVGESISEFDLQQAAGIIDIL